MTLFELGFYSKDQATQIKEKLSTLNDYEITLSGETEKLQTITVLSKDLRFSKEASQNIFLNYCLSLLAS